MKELIKKLFYKLEFGRKIYWNLRAEDSNKRYHRLQHDFEVPENIMTTIKPKRLLDFGCGHGKLFPIYQNFGIN